MRRGMETIIEIGPFESVEAEWLTEQTLDSKVTFTAFEQLYRGDISPSQFLSLIQFQLESLHSDYLVRERELIREACYE
jgi:hypothetical protein